jgi:branched-chain amino acid transport system ATP-binding protein
MQAHHLTRRFGGLVAVDNVSLAVQPETLHSIIGPNGAGKTTLFNLLSGYLKPTSGRVTFKGADLTHVPTHRIAHLGIARSFQITNIFPNLTVLENIRLAAQAMGPDNFKLFRPAVDFARYTDRALEVIALVGLAGREAMLATALPHGDKRKLELGILLAPDPELLLLDEPTAGMASEQVPQLMEIIAGIRRQSRKTIMLVEHNMSVVMNVSDRISVMHQGALLAEGRPEEIAANETVQSAYLGHLYGSLGRRGEANS